MLFHSIIPLEVVFQQDNLDNYDFTTRFIQYNGYQVEVMPLKNGQTQIKRIFSTNPRDFLDPKLQPGMILDSIPVSKTK